jgi:hypothetical protein
MATTKTKKYMPEVKATGKKTKSTVANNILAQWRLKDRQYTAKNLADSLPLKPTIKPYVRKNPRLSEKQLEKKSVKDIDKILYAKGGMTTSTKTEKQEGGPTNTSGRLTRLGNKIARKTDAGKTVSEGLQKRYDKAADKVIIKQLKKSTKEKAKTKMAKGGTTSFGMLSVKAGIDKNPKPTAADRIAGAKKKRK